MSFIMPVNLVFCKLKTAVLFCEEFTWRESSFLETKKNVFILWLSVLQGWTYGVTIGYGQFFKSGIPLLKNSLYDDECLWG